MNWWMRVLQTLALPLGHVTIMSEKPAFGAGFHYLSGAADEARTRYLHLGKVALYQMSYGRRFHCGAPGVPGDVDYYTAAFASCQLQICIF